MLFIAGVLRSRGIRLDPATLREGRSLRGVTKALAERLPAIVRVEHLVPCDDFAKQPGIWTPWDASLSTHATLERLHVLPDSKKNAEAALGVAFGAVNGDAIQVGMTPRVEIELWSAVLFSLSLKKAGVERARVAARDRPRTR
jgi:hypothetical protein